MAAAQESHPEGEEGSAVIEHQPQADTSPPQPQKALMEDAPATPTAAPPTTAPETWSGAWWKAFLLKWHLPLLLLLGLVLGVAWSPPAAAADDTPLSLICVILIFFISGLKLKSDDLRAALAVWPAWTYGLATILLITPLLAFPLAALPLQREEFSLGHALFALMPTTISSCIVLTGSAKGNVALALFLSVVTNLLSTVAVPLWLTAVLSSIGGVSLDPVALLVRLLYTILAPLVAGKLAQLIPGVPALVTQHKNTLKVVSSLFLCLIPWSKAGSAAGDLTSTSPGAIFTMVGIGAGMHLVFLALNASAVRLMALQWPESSAVVLAGSQKTLSVAVAVIDAAPAALGAPGLLLVPCILSHFTQIVMDAVLFTVLRSRMAANEAAAAEAEAQDVEKGAGIEMAPTGSEAGAESAPLSASIVEVVVEGGGDAAPLSEEGGEEGGVLAAATAVHSAEFRSLMQAAPAGGEEGDKDEPAAFGVAVDQAAAATGQEGLGSQLVEDLLDDSTLTEDAVPAKEPRIGGEFQVDSLPEPQRTEGEE